MTFIDYMSLLEASEAVSPTVALRCQNPLHLIENLSPTRVKVMIFLINHDQENQNHLNPAGCIREYSIIGENCM